MRPATASRLRVSTSHRQAAARNAAAVAKRYNWFVRINLPQRLAGRPELIPRGQSLCDIGAQLVHVESLNHAMLCEAVLKYPAGATVKVPTWAKEIKRWKERV